MLVRRKPTLADWRIRETYGERAFTFLLERCAHDDFCFWYNSDRPTFKTKKQQVFFDTSFGDPT